MYSFLMLFISYDSKPCSSMLQRLIETAPWGDDAESLEQQNINHNKFHNSIQRSTEMDRARDELVRDESLTRDLSLNLCSSHSSSLFSSSSKSICSSFSSPSSSSSSSFFPFVTELHSYCLSVGLVYKLKPL